MNFLHNFLNNQRKGMLEGRVLGSISMVLLIYFLSSSIGSVPGFPAVGYLPGIIVVIIAVVEFIKPWTGFYIFLLFWPVMLLVKVLLSRSLGPQWAGLPEFWGWPFAAALATGCWLRFESLGTRISSCDIKLNDSAHARSIWLTAFRICLWGLLLTFSISYLAAARRLHHPPADWVVHPGAQQAMFHVVLAYVPSLILGLLLLNQLSKEERYSAGKPDAYGAVTELPLKKMVLFAVIGGTIAAFFFLYQWKTGISWSFNSSPHAWPFENRNTTAPFFVIIGALLIGPAALPTVIEYLLGVAFVMLAIKTGSRNGVLMIICLGWGALMGHIRWRHVVLVNIFLVVVIVIFGSILFLLPFPGNNPTQSLSRIVGPALAHFAASAAHLCVDGISPKSLGVRYRVFNAAERIFRDYPFFGSGPGTFNMLTASGARYGNIVCDDLYAAHSMPFNLLAETGFPGMLSWSAVWIMLPLLAVIRRKKANAFALVLLVIGLGNLFDTVWMVPGMTTFSVLVVVWACLEMNSGGECGLLNGSK